MTLPIQHQKGTNLLNNKKTSTEVNGKPLINEEKDEMVLIKSKPLRGIYSYEKSLRMFNKRQKRCKIKKAIKKKTKSMVHILLQV